MKGERKAHREGGVDMINEVLFFLQNLTWSRVRIQRSHFWGGPAAMHEMGGRGVGCTYYPPRKNSKLGEPKGKRNGKLVDYGIEICHRIA